MRNSSLTLGELTAFGLVVLAISLVISGAFMLYRFWCRQAWKKVAAELDLHCDESRYHVEGDLYEMFVVVRIEERSQGTGKKTVTQYEAPLGGHGIPPMRLQPEHRLMGIELDKLLKRTEMEIGLKVIDDAFIINGEDHEAIGEFFKRSGVASALLRCVKNARGQVTYNKGRLRITHEGIAGEKKLRQNLDELARCAAALAKAGRAQMADFEGVSTDDSEADQNDTPAKFGAW